MPIKVSYLALAGAGGIIAYSGLKGKGISSAARAVLTGNGPATATAADQITPATYAYGYGAGTTTNTAPVVGPTSAGETAWIVALLASIAAPPTKANINSIAGWIQHESSWNSSPPDGALYTHNPLNTTQPGFGAVGSVNSVGVKIYPTSVQGIAATVKALTNGDYGDILAALRSGKGLTGSYRGLSTWSGGGYSSI
jgi:hypothetical protein